MDQTKPPGQWDDGVREPRVVLSAEPNRDLLASGKRRVSDVAVADQRGARPAADEGQAPVSHPRLKNRQLEEAPDTSEGEDAP